MTIRTHRWMLYMLAPAILHAAQVDAQPAPAPASDSEGTKTPNDDKLARAKELFRTGNTFLKNGDHHRALELFLGSREMLPSYQNTVNAAICLDQLERFDEALELYEAALIEFPNDISPELRLSLEPKLRELRERIGSLEVSANVTGTVIIDGRERGKLPLRTPLRVLPGERLVRVIKDGYATFEGRVKVKAKESERLDAQLKPLASAGRLRVETPDGTAAELRVDGATVGKLPWEGTLAPGNHVYEVARDDLGSGPQQVTILQGQTALVRAAMKPLSKPLRLVVSPPSAKLTLDDRPTDPNWHGRLTVGRHRLAAREEGYLPSVRELDVDANTSGDLSVELAVDRNHPRWAKPDPSRVWVEAAGGFAIGTSLGSRAEECSAIACTSNKLALGPVVGARAAYEFPIRLSLELSAAYAALGTEVKRRFSEPFDTTEITYSLTDKITLRGAKVTAGIGYRQPFGQVFGLQVRAHVGAFIISARDMSAAQASAPGRGSVSAVVPESGVAKQSVALVVEPEIQAHFKLGHLRLGAGLSAVIAPLAGPENGQTEIYPAQTPACTVSTPLPISCATASNAVAHERLFGPFVAVMPSLSAGYEF